MIIISSVLQLQRIFAKIFSTCCILWCFLKSPNSTYFRECFVYFDYYFFRSASPPCTKNNATCYTKVLWSAIFFLFCEWHIIKKNHPIKSRNYANLLHVFIGPDAATSNAYFFDLSFLHNFVICIIVIFLLCSLPDAPFSRYT